MKHPAASDEASIPARPIPGKLRSELLVSGLVLAAGLIATFLLWHNEQHQHQQELQSEFDARAREAGLKIERRLSNYQNVLRGLQALYAASDRVDRNEFSAYATALHLDESFPGIQSLGYSPLVTADQLQRHLAELRSQGFPGYRIEPAGARERYAPAVHVEPRRDRNPGALGLDSYASPERRAALEHARDSGDASLSGKLSLVRDGESTVPGTMMILPVYRNGAPTDTLAARRAGIAGWVSATFRMDALMLNLLGSHTPYLDIEIYDAPDMSAAALLYDSETARGGPESAAAFRSTRQIQVADRTWTVSYTSSPAFDSRLAAPHAAIEAAIGSLASLTLAMCAWLLLRSRKRALLDAWRLKKAMHQSESASRAKSEFLANIGHELRTPMNAILGMTHLALAEETEPRQRSRLEKIQYSGELLLNTIDNILDYSGMEYGATQSHPVDFTLHKVLGELESFAARKASDKGVELSIDIAPELSRRRLHDDAGRLEQVLHNFLDNALKFTPGGRITLRVLRQDEDEATLKLRFEVQDTGIGIETEKLRHLFSPFWQADSSLARQHEGVGLGLAICKKLIERMKEGQFGVDSVAGSGSTFWFTTRLDKAHAGHMEHKAAAATSGNYTHIKGARILVAEDNVLSQTIIGGLLESAGALVQRAHNGAEVLEALRRESFDCVLMDVQMPEMDGIASTRAIRKELGLTDLPVIAVTAHASKENRQRCLDAGMNDFIGKPFTPASLYSRLAHWLPPRGDARPMQPPAAPMPAAGKSVRSSEGEIIDLSQLAGLIGDDREKMREFAGKFLELARQDVSSIETALERNDRETLARLAHHNKAPARMVGASGFADLCQELSELSKQAASSAQIGKVVARMGPLLDMIEQRVRQELAY